MIHTAEIAGATDVTSAHSTLKTSTYRDEGVNSLPGLSS